MRDEHDDDVSVFSLVTAFRTLLVMPIFLVCGREPFTTSVHVDVTGGFRCSLWRKRPAGSWFLCDVVLFELNAVWWCERAREEGGGEGRGGEGF